MLFIRIRSRQATAIDRVNWNPLRFDFSGNILELSIPANVSPDMPPTELIPNLDINDPSIFSESSQIAVMKVLYDFPRPRFWQEDYGSMAMTIRVHKKPSNYEGDIFQREHLIKAVQVDLKAAYQSFNEKTWQEGLAAGKLAPDLVDEMMNFPGNTDEMFRDHEFNNEPWVMHTLTGLETHGMYYCPLTAMHYLCVDFYHMESRRTFLSDLTAESTPYSDAILNTIKLKRAASGHAQVSSGITIEGQS